jgi:hypothetical protein
MSNDTFDPRQASGESAMRGSRPLELNEVSLNGDGQAKEIAPGKFERKGGYFRKRILVGKPKDQKPEEIDLGKKAVVVFLKVRRRLIERGREGEIIRSTGEHNAPTDAVTLYEGATKEKRNGVAADLRKEFPNLRTVQTVYSLLCEEKSEPELVRLIVKGASLKSDVKAPDVPDFYQYISSFTGQDHFYEYKTVLTPVLEEGKQTYFAINFQRGEKLDEKRYAYALEQMRKVDENCKDIDQQRAQRIVKDTVAPSETTERGEEEATEDVIDYPKDDIGPEDIPFN